jgi:ketosteroid isomerase-like protein
MDAISSPASSAAADEVRSAAQRRLSALLTNDKEVASQIHADDFQLVTPLGAVFSKEEYLGAVAAGIIHYLAMELDSPIDVRLYHDVALIRYRAQIEVEVQGQAYPRAPYRFTDAYEKRDGHWRIVWSQGTGIA